MSGAGAWVEYWISHSNSSSSLNSSSSSSSVLIPFHSLLCHDERFWSFQADNGHSLVGGRRWEDICMVIAKQQKGCTGGHIIVVTTHQFHKHVVPYQGRWTRRYPCCTFRIQRFHDMRHHAISLQHGFESTLILRIQVNVHSVQGAVLLQTGQESVLNAVFKFNRTITVVPAG
jgi:hypothetical protein